MTECLRGSHDVCIAWRPLIQHGKGWCCRVMWRQMRLLDAAACGITAAHAPLLAWQGATPTSLQPCTAVRLKLEPGRRRWGRGMGCKRL